MSCVHHSLDFVETTEYCVEQCLVRKLSAEDEDAGIPGVRLRRYRKGRVPPGLFDMGKLIDKRLLPGSRATGNSSGLFPHAGP